MNIKEFKKMIDKKIQQGIDAGLAQKMDELFTFNPGTKPDKDENEKNEKEKSLAAARKLIADSEQPDDDEDIESEGLTSQNIMDVINSIKIGDN